MNEIRTTSAERRSSVRVRSLLACGVRPVDPEDIPAVEARILDVAVLESDSILSDKADWSERTDELSREIVFVLSEMRALRQQIAEIQHLVESQSSNPLIPRWVVLNDNGLFLPSIPDDYAWEVGAPCEVRLQIPNLQTREILAVGEVVRVGGGEDGVGVGIAFRYISQAHSKAIIRYALRRERQIARSLRFP